MNVTGQYLLQGMWYALESCGEGLQAAVELFRSGHYARSVALAMAARDELGNASLFRDLWRRIEGGGTVTFDEVRAICGATVKGTPSVKHLTKQEAAQPVVRLRSQPGDAIALVSERRYRALQELTRLREQGVPSYDPQTASAYADWHAAEQDFERFVEDAKQRKPGERVRLRNRCLYVDAIRDPGIVSWTRPNETTHDEARDALAEAVGDYRFMCLNLQPESAALSKTGGSPTFAAALAAWVNKPALPEVPVVLD